jgi:hypothetical protein
MYRLKKRNVILYIQETPPSALMSAEKLAQARNSSQVCLVTILSLDGSPKGIMATLVGHRVGVQYADSIWLEKSKKCGGGGAVVWMDWSRPAGFYSQSEETQKDTARPLGITAAGRVSPQPPALLQP